MSNDIEIDGRVHKTLPEYLPGDVGIRLMGGWVRRMYQLKNQRKRELKWVGGLFRGGLRSAAFCFPI